MAPEPATTWIIHFFQRHRSDDPTRSVPGLEFLDSIPSAEAATIYAVLAAVAEAPPPSFSGGGMWEVMRGKMSGFYEVRTTGNKTNHRLFCLLLRDADDLGGPSIVCLGGLSKPPRSPARDKDYRTIRKYRAEFERRRTVVS